MEKNGKYKKKRKWPSIRSLSFKKAAAVAAGTALLIGAILL